VHPFRKFILNYSSFSQRDWDQVELVLKKKKYRKGELLLEEGKICRKLSFLESGFLRFYINKDGNDVSKFFTEPPYCFTSQRSFNNEIPAQENIEALEESIVWEIDKSATEDLLKIPNWSNFARKLTQEVQFFTEQILEDIQNLTAEERYFKMMKDGHIYLEKVPLKYLASYLGIAPQSLSRIRKKYFDQKGKLT